MAQLTTPASDKVSHRRFRKEHVFIALLLITLLWGLIRHTIGVRVGNTRTFQIALMPSPSHSSSKPNILPTTTLTLQGAASIAVNLYPSTVPYMFIPTIIGFATPTTDPVMADWKTYADSISGFTFKYPGYWVFNGLQSQGYLPYRNDVSIEGKTRVASFSDQNITNPHLGYLLIVTVDDNIENMPLVELLDNDSEKTIVAGYPAIRQLGAPHEKYILNAPGLQKQNARYIFNFTTDFSGAEDQPSKTAPWVQQEIANFDRVISSFKILQ